jgi:sulfur-carrier protein
MPQLRLFASAREAAGTTGGDLPGTTVGEVLDAAVGKYGDDFARVLTICRVWVNGDQATSDTEVGEGDVVAVLPPVSGG